MSVRKWFTNKIDAGNAHQLDVVMKKKPTDDLTAAITASADDGGFEAFRHARKLARLAARVARANLRKRMTRVGKSKHSG